LSYETLVKVQNLQKWFPVRTGLIEELVFKKKKYVKAVDGITFDIKKREIFGLVGESGSGKTTSGRLLLNLIKPTGGKVYFGDQDITKFNKKELKNYRKKAQIIFQNPYESLDPKMTIFDFIAEPLHVHNIENVEERVYESLKTVELNPPEEFFMRYPHELSGGQRQRVAIARASVLDPEFIVADEPVSMLDVSIRSSLLKLMLNIRRDRGISYLYVTHDLATAREVCNRIAVMYLGKIVEEATTDKLLENPLHPYSQALIAAVPVPDPEARKSRVTISGEIPSPIDLPSGCRFRPRCPHAIDICKNVEPELISVDDDHKVACNLVNS